MSSTVALEIGSDLWNARVYAGLSVAAELAAGLDQQRVVKFPLSTIWRVYSRLGRLNRDLENILSEYDLPVLPVVPGVKNRVGRDILLKLSDACKSLPYPPKGVAFLAPIVKRLDRLNLQSERILDLADWLDAMSDPSEMDARFSKLAEDVAKGDFVPLAALK